MRIQGTLAKWNEERGFGFIKPEQGGDDLFVHITAFPRDAARPRIGELLSFEVEITPEGKKRAVRIWRIDASGRASFTLEPAPHRDRRATAPARPARHASKARHEPYYPRPRRSSGMRFAVAIAILASLGAFSYSRMSRPPKDASVPLFAPSSISEPALQYQCDGRQHCSQMRSYDEAKWFLDNCPNMKMDGDNDGIPCESQFN